MSPSKTNCHIVTALFSRRSVVTENQSCLPAVRPGRGQKRSTRWELISGQVILLWTAVSSHVNPHTYPKIRINTRKKKHNKNCLNGLYKHLKKNTCCEQQNQASRLPRDRQRHWRAWVFLSATTTLNQPSLPLSHPYLYTLTLPAQN